MENINYVILRIYRTDGIPAAKIATFLGGSFEIVKRVVDRHEEYSEFVRELYSCG